ncbi:DeoR/GlpR family DNA-binding transcription regulator [Arthrobacter sp. KK5.5]|uniref:DeoR/GlpR family DNA-binding transcription regulator n=1 Tax=Arthrobacter sp. KK5.5 TaxID=3373084 RepID=UPI003EE53926
MFAEERHRLIGGLVATQGQVTVAELSGQFDITRETVRRDLAHLEKSGALRRVHGGAVSTAKASTAEESLSVRTDRNLDDKRRIAVRALELIPAGNASVVLDAGTTTELLAAQMVETLAPHRAAELLVVTHAVPIAYRISAASDFALEILGGRVRGLTSAALGSRTIDQLGDLRPDIAFIGANGVHADFGLSTPDPMEAAVKTAIVRSARRVVVLADASKLDVETLVRFAAFDDVDTLVTTGTPSRALASALEQADIEVVSA